MTDPNTFSQAVRRLAPIYFHRQTVESPGYICSCWQKVNSLGHCFTGNKLIDSDAQAVASFLTVSQSLELRVAFVFACLYVCLCIAHVFLYVCLCIVHVCLCIVHVCLCIVHVFLYVCLCTVHVYV